MAIPVARVYLAMAHAALPGLLPTPPKCVMMMPPLLPTPSCVVIMPTSSPPKHSRADTAERWDAHKTKPAAGSPKSSSSSSSGGRHSLNCESGSPGRASSCERWGSNKTKIAGAAAPSSASRTGNPERSSSSSNSRANSEERWDARKKPVSLSSSSSSARSNNMRCHGSNSSKRRPNSRATSTAGHKKPTAARKDENEIDDGESSTGSNDVEYLNMPPRRMVPQRELYAGPGFMAAAPHRACFPCQRG